MSEREYVVDRNRYRTYVREWSFENGDWPRASPGHQRDCLSLLREVEELEKKNEELRFGVGVHWPDDIRAALAMMTSDRDSLKARLEEAEDRCAVAAKAIGAIAKDHHAVKVKCEELRKKTHPDAKHIIVLRNQRDKAREEKEKLVQMLEDVVNELDLSDSAIAEHGPMGTPPAQLVRLVLEQKDKTIRMLEAGMVDAQPAREEGTDA